MIGQIRLMTVYTKTHTPNSAPATAGQLVTGSDQIGLGQRWRIFGVRFFATSATNWVDALWHGCLAQLQDDDGYNFGWDRFDIPAATAATVGGAYTSPWMTYPNGLIGTKLGAKLFYRFRPIPATTLVDVANGDVGVTISAALDDDPSA